MVKLIIYEMLLAFMQFIPAAALSGCLLIILICLFLSLFSGKSPVWIIRNNRLKLSLIFISYIYFFITLSITILSRASNSRDDMTLELFGTFTKNAYYNRYPVENIILFIPFGFLLPLLWNRSRKALPCIAAGFVLSILIETVQFLTKRGYVQTDDVVMNSIGTLIGFWLVSGCRAIYSKKKQNKVFQ